MATIDEETNIEGEAGPAAPRTTLRDPVRESEGQSFDGFQTITSENILCI